MEKSVGTWKRKKGNGKDRKSAVAVGCVSLQHGQIGRMVFISGAITCRHYSVSSVDSRKTKV